MPTRLTTLARVKGMVFSGSDDDTGEHDELLDRLIDEVSDQIERLCGRTFAKADYTEYYDGTGTDTLYLRQGPLVTVTSVQIVEYSDAGDGSQQETLTDVEAYQYVLGGKRADGRIGAGFLRLLSGVWTEGVLNYKVVYSAGFEDDRDVGEGNIPQGLVRVATSHVAAVFNLRGLEGLTSREVGDGSMTTIPDENLQRALVRAITPFRLPVVR